jgi:hypothetical protein
MSDFFTYKDIAKRLGIDSGTVRRLIQRVGPQLGIAVQQGRTGASNAKWAHYLSRDDTERLVACYQSKGKGELRGEDAPEDAFQAAGIFYVIQLIPELRPDRLKVGYTDSLEKRLAEHQTAAPTARVLASWPCKRSWDYAAMDCITREDCTWLNNEVFEGDPDGFVQRGNTFFALMPIPDSKRRLSEHSPMIKK